MTLAGYRTTIRGFLKRRIYAIQETSVHGGRPVVKTIDGWKPIPKGTKAFDDALEKERRKPSGKKRIPRKHTKATAAVEREKLRFRVMINHVAEYFGLSNRKTAAGLAKKEYVEHNVADRFKIDLSEWQRHWTEYWQNKQRWDSLFNRERARKPGANQASEPKPKRNPGKQPTRNAKPQFRKNVMRFLSSLYRKEHGTTGANTGERRVSEPADVGPETAHRDAAKHGQKPGASRDNRQSLVDGGASGNGTGDGADRGRITGARQRNINQQVRDLLANKSDNQFTSAELSLLQQYAGRGGVPGEKGQGVLSEYYTPHTLVEKMWDIARQYAGPGSKVLEPAAGTGRFAAGRKDFKITQVEIDPDSARINAALNPETEVKNVPFQKLFMGGKLGLTARKKYTGEKYDLLIGNPPYGEFHNEFRGMGEGKEHTTFQEYFIERGLDTLKDGGHLVYVVPSRFLQSGDSKVKQLIASKGRLVEAWRLPNGIFPTTDVGTDIIVIKKGKGDPKTFSDDAYFKSSPDRVTGPTETAIGRFGPTQRIKGDLSSLQQITTRPPITEEVRQKIGKALEGNQNAKKNGPKKEPAKKKTSSADDSEKADVHDLQSFVDEYRQEYDQRDVEIWKSVDPDGSIRIKSAAVPEGESAVDFDPARMSVYKGKVFHNVSYASGDIYEKLDQLETERGELEPQQYARQKKLLQQALPERRAIENVDLSPINTFVQGLDLPDGNNLVESFIQWVQMKARSAELRGSTVQEIVEYTERRASTKKASETVDQHRKRRRRRRVQAERLFNEFVRKELPAEDRSFIEDRYNRTLNGIAPVDVRRLPIFVDGIARTWKGGAKLHLNHAQIGGVAFLGLKGSGLLAYGVGVGKTIAGIMATVQSMQRGWCKRPLVIVPKSVVENWRRNFAAVFPNVKVNFLGNMRKALRHENLPEGRDGEITLMSYEGFYKGAFKSDTLRSLVGDIQDAMDNFPAEARAMTERVIQQNEQKAAEKAGEAQSGGEYYFEDMGFDHITVDEIHNFKNVFSRARLRKNEDRGNHNEYHVVSGGKSTRAAKLWLFAQYVQKLNNGRGVYGLSATPFTNSPMEIYNILSILARDRLKKMGIFNVHDFISAFALLRTENVVKADGSIQEADVIKEFRNLPELQKLVREYVDFRGGEEVGVKRPELDEQVVEMTATPEQVEIFEEAEFDYNAQSERNSASKLKAITTQRMATLSPKLVTGEGHFVKDSPKLKYTFDMVARVHAQKPTVGQVVYIPVGVKYFSEAVDYLVENSDLKRDQIGIVDGNVSAEKRQKILDEFNKKDGQIKVLIGGRGIKEGVNAQKNCPVLYNTHMEWNPTDLEQVRGRIWRQNNPFPTAHVFYPVLSDSIDAMMYQKHDEKLRRLQSLWSYKGDSIDVSDIDPEEMKYALIKDPATQASYRIDLEQKVLREEMDDKNAQLARLMRVKTGTPGLGVENDGLEELESLVKYNSDWVAKFGKSIKERTAKISKLERAKKKRELTEAELYDIRIETRYRDSEREELKVHRDALKKARLYELKLLGILNALRIPRKDLDSEIGRIEAQIGEVESMMEKIEAKRDSYIKEAQKNIDKAKIERSDSDMLVAADSARVLKTIEQKIKSGINYMGPSTATRPDYRNRIRKGLSRRRSFVKATVPDTPEGSYRHQIRYFLKRKELPIGAIRTHGGVKKKKVAPGDWQAVKSEKAPGAEEDKTQAFKKIINPYPVTGGKMALPTEPPRPDPNKPFVDSVPGLPTDTLETYTAKDGGIVPERKKLHDAIAKKHLETAKPVPEHQRPRAIMMMGGPASGKSTMVRGSGLDTSNFVVADADGVKELLPEYRMAVRANARSASTIAHEESSSLVKRIRSEAIDENKNLVIDGTGSRITSYETNLKRLVEQGYHTTLLLADCGADEAVKRAGDRAQKTGRFVPEKFIRDSYGGIPKNFVDFRHKVDEFSVFDTGRKPPQLVWSKKDGKETVHDEGWMKGFLDRAGGAKAGMQDMKKSKSAVAPEPEERKPQHTLDQIESMILNGFAEAEKQDAAAHSQFPSDDGIKDVPYELTD